MRSILYSDMLLAAKRCWRNEPVPRIEAPSDLTEAEQPLSGFDYGSGGAISICDPSLYAQRSSLCPEREAMNDASLGSIRHLFRLGC